MSLYKKAGLVQIPSGYKADKLYSVVPNNGDGDFDFTRASTATRVNKDGLIETVAINQARLDYPLLDGVVQDNPVLLLEPERTNYVENSEITSTWTYTEFGSGSAGTITTGKTDMFGGTNAVQVDFPADAENVAVRFGAITSALTSGSASLSLYIKLVESGSKVLRLRASSSVNVNVNSTEFKRISVSLNKNSSEAFNLKLRPSEGTSSGGFSIIICHPQEEAGSYPTSYIKTQGATVTRSADVCNGAGTANDFNDSEGVLYANIAFTKEPVSGFVTISDGTDDERITIYRVGSLFPNKIQCQIREGNTARVSFGFDTNFIDLYNKIAIKYKANDFAFWVNGFEIDSNTSNTLIPDNLNNLEFAEGDGGNPFNGKTKEVMTFKEALSDIELETLTSYKSFNEMATEQLYTIK